MKVTHTAERSMYIPYAFLLQKHSVMQDLKLRLHSNFQRVQVKLSSQSTNPLLDLLPIAHHCCLNSEISQCIL